MTSAVITNCGFGFAPCRPEMRDGTTVDRADWRLAAPVHTAETREQAMPK